MSATQATLYGYYRSSTSYRLRILLNLKDIAHRTVAVALDKGEQRDAAFLAINPMGGLPVLEIDGLRLVQSPAIIDYIEEHYASPRLLPGAIEPRQRVREIASLVACDIHPLNNLKVWKGYVGKVLGANEQQSQDWYAHWIHEGFKAYEALLGDNEFTYRDSPTLADLHLIPQLYNARRFNLDLSAYPKICKIEKNCMRLEAFQKASPESHPNAPDNLEQIHGKNAAFLKAA